MTIPCLATLTLFTGAWIVYAAPLQKGKAEEGKSGKAEKKPPGNPKSAISTPSTQPPIPPPTQLRRIALVAPLPPGMQAQAAHVDVDTLEVAGSLPVVWRGNARMGTADVPIPAAATNEQAQRLRRAANATLTRLQPFTAPNTITVNAAGLPIIAWESADAALKRAGQAGEEVVFDLPAPAQLSPAAWKAFAEAVLRRYGAPSSTQVPVTIARWEVACGEQEAPSRYETFARLAHSLTPHIPVGLNIVTGDAGEGLRRAALRCVQNKIPLDSVAWQVTEGFPAMGQIQRIRQALAAFPALKGTVLLPTLAVAHSDSSVAAPLASACVRLMQAVSPTPPNPFVGALAQIQTDTGQDRENETQPDPQVCAAQTLTLLNRLAGTRLRASSDDSGIGCLAARSQARTLVLLWREPASSRLLPQPPHSPDANNALVQVHLRHLPLTGSLRVTRCEPDQPSSRYSWEAGLETGQENKAKPGETPVPPPISTADILPVGNVLPGEVELPVLLAPGGVCLLEIAPGKPAASPIDLTLTTQSVGVCGGDTLDVVLTARNMAAKPQKLEVALASTLPDMLTPKIMRLQLGKLAANETHAFRFVLQAPVRGAAANVTLNVRANVENAATLTIPITAPLSVGLETARADVENGTGHANARVRLSNHGHVKLNVQLLAKDAGGSTVTLAPDGKPVMVAIALTPPSREPGVYPLSLLVKNQNNLLQTLYPLLGVSFVTPYAAVKPTIDGDLSEWADSESMGIGRAEQAHGKAWGGPTDVSAYAHARWDERFFYFACAVTDDVFAPPSSAARLEQGDCVLFALAAPPDGKPHTAGESVGYAKFGMASAQNRAGELNPMLVRFPTEPVSRKGSRLKAAPEPVKNARIAIQHEGARTFYEVAIPWSELRPGAAVSGMTAALSILVNDVDGEARGYMTWGGGLTGTPNPALFIPLRLVK